MLSTFIELRISKRNKIHTIKKKRQDHLLSSGGTSCNILGGPEPKNQKDGYINEDLFWLQVIETHTKMRKKKKYIGLCD